MKRVNKESSDNVRAISQCGGPYNVCAFFFVGLGVDKEVVGLDQGRDENVDVDVFDVVFRGVAESAGEDPVRSIKR